MLSDSESVKKWLSRMDEPTRRPYLAVLRRFYDWLEEVDPPLLRFSPDEFIAFQKENKDFQVLDVVQSYILSLDYREGSKRAVYSTLRSFFMHNRASLPQDRGFRIRGSIPKVVGTLTLDNLKMVLASSNRCYRSVFLCMFQGGMGQSELVFWSNNGFRILLEQLDNGVKPIRVDLPGRKKAKYGRPYYTFLGRDAINALRKWMDERGRESGAIFLNQFGQSISSKSISRYWIKHLTKLGLVDRVPNPTPKTRYGKNVHELRDLFRSRWQKSGRVPEAAEFFMGHVIDPLEYNKAFRDENYARMEYRRAEKWLNILSEDPEHVHIDEVDGMVDELLKAKGFLLEDARKRIEILESQRK